MSTTNKPNPADVLAELKAQLGKRAHANLDNVHEVCRAISTANGDPSTKDYAISTVGRKLAKLGKGPSYNTLQAPSGDHFRRLIRAWAEFEGASTVKQAAPRRLSPDDELLSKISDPAVRSDLGFRLAEGRRHLADLNTLKGKTIVTVDMRPKDGLAHAQGGPLQLVVPAVSLLDSEREALKSALDELHLKRFGIAIGADGELIQHGKVLFDVGFASGLRKLVD